MTDIDAMPSGPELDRLVAEKVMGWKWYSPGHYAMAADGAQSQWTGPLATSKHNASWSPSTRIEHAWELMNKLYDPVVFSGEGGLWHAATMDYGDGFGDGWIDTGIDYHATADTAPLAICRCALKKFIRSYVERLPVSPESPSSQ